MGTLESEPLAVADALLDVGFVEGGALEVALAATMGNLHNADHGFGIVRPVERPALGWLGPRVH